jgi:hypothetical protein
MPRYSELGCASVLRRLEDRIRRIVWQGHHSPRLQRGSANSFRSSIRPSGAHRATQKTRCRKTCERGKRLTAGEAICIALARVCNMEQIALRHLRYLLLEQEGGLSRTIFPPAVWPLYSPGAKSHRFFSQEKSSTNNEHRR